MDRTERLHLIGSVPLDNSEQVFRRLAGELGPGMPVNSKHTNIGPRLTIVDKKGKTIARLGGEHGPGQETGKFLSPHGLAVDSRGDIYVGEVSYTNWGGTHPGVPVPKYLRSLQKLEKVK